MSTVPSDDDLPSWEQLLTGVGVASADRPWGDPRGAGPRHLRRWTAGFPPDAGCLLHPELRADLALDDGMSWSAAAGWAVLAAGCAGAIAHAAAPLLP